MRPSEFELNECAALITVISMQFLAVYGEGAVDPYDFLLSGICLGFAILAFQRGCAHWFTKLLISVNGGISLTFFILIPVSFLYYWLGNLIDWLPSWNGIGIELPLSEYQATIQMPGTYKADITWGELASMLMILPAAGYVFSRVPRETPQ